MTRVLLIRHATTEATGTHLAGRAAGIGLDGQGRRQAQALAGRLAGLPIAAIYSSPLQRTLETAEPIARLLGRETIPCEDFLEIEFGEWTGRAIAGLEDDAAFRRFNAVRSRAPAAGGEYMLQAQARMVLGLEALRLRHPRQTVVVVGHGDPIKAAVAYYAGIPLDLFHRLEIDPASVSAIELGDDAVRILAVNDTGGAWA
ncbi:histidine phosphatase family protein [Vulcaniibacterium tengchongense]|uniref:Putative phosphoglycerate mutase n=1 Tax=Vulcaniibacterium tengchongense TaxID=1273429 RepID=A0A3N4VJJ4_9GAMM|nr:histidine phosphatase family protein [Vulcaniibacterium tengchongense]RPE81595.1 putative phosphoglycerate mutase [Vulcaniibacterium tengchongense]